MTMTSRTAARIALTRMPLRDDVTELEYHRKPTAGEIAFGEGAIHYATFDADECCYPGTRIAKRRIVRDGLVYTC